ARAPSAVPAAAAPKGTRPLVNPEFPSAFPHPSEIRIIRKKKRDSPLPSPARDSPLCPLLLAAAACLDAHSPLPDAQKARSHLRPVRPAQPRPANSGTIALGR
uniref:Uncharacterized protein n=1 Tax=Aegilops tauschii subsp. strangulata TaxID=200361 RepID=A0A453NR39_AEGTS